MRRRMLEKIDKNTKAEDLSGWRKKGRKAATNWKAQVNQLQKIEEEDSIESIDDRE